MALGGLREDYPGTAMGEDTDISIRVRNIGRRLYFAPAAHIIHDSAPHVVGQRFDLRYEFYAHSNYTLLFLRNFGWKASEVRGRLLAPLQPQDSNRRLLSRVARHGISAAGVSYGLWLHLMLDRGQRAPLVRSH